MKVLLFVVGKLKESYLRDAEKEYLKRLRPYCKLEVVEHKDERALLAALPGDAHIYALDERGDMLDSEQFAAMVADESMTGRGAPMVFVIGGADGHTDELRVRAKKLLAFGRLTIAHRLVRLLVLEQIYRAYKIINNEPYHRA